MNSRVYDVRPERADGVSVPAIVCLDRETALIAAGVFLYPTVANYTGVSITMRPPMPAEEGPHGG